MKSLSSTLEAARWRRRCSQPEAPPHAIPRPAVRVAPKPSRNDPERYDYLTPHESWPNACQKTRKSVLPL
jgi:hypothetical protein